VLDKVGISVSKSLVPNDLRPAFVRLVWELELLRWQREVWVSLMRGLSLTWLIVRSIRGIIALSW